MPKPMLYNVNTALFLTFLKPKNQPKVSGISSVNQRIKLS